MLTVVELVIKEHYAYIHPRSQLTNLNIFLPPFFFLFFVFLTVDHFQDNKCSANPKSKCFAIPKEKSDPKKNVLDNP